MARCSFPARCSLREVLDSMAASFHFEQARVSRLAKPLEVVQRWEVVQSVAVTVAVVEEGMTAGLNRRVGEVRSAVAL